MADFESNIEVNIPEQLQANLHYFNLNNQLMYDIEQQNAIKMQQLEAIRLIQISLEKLTATTTVPLHNQTTRAASKTAGTQPPPTILVYKETSLHKNLLVSKMLNKAKYLYYQTIVQTMRMSLMSKLNYYSSLIHQLYPSTDTTSKSGKLSDLDNTTAAPKTNTDESKLIDEMKVLMQQILHDTYQFNSFNSATTNITNKVVDDEKKVLQERSPSNLNKPNDETCMSDESSNNNIEQNKRIKQLNDVKHSLYSLLFPQADNVVCSTSSIDDTKQTKFEGLKKSNSQNENVSKRKSSSSNDHQCSSHKRARLNKIYCSIDSNNNQVILGEEDSNLIKVSNRKSLKKERAKPHISTKLLKLSLKTATKNAEKFNLESDSFNMNLEVLV